MHKNITSEKNLAELSSLSFLIPGFIALESGFLVFGILALCVVFVSILYHKEKKSGPHWPWDKKRSKKEHSLLALDTFVAALFAGYGFYLFYLKNFPTLFWVALIIFIPLFIQFLFPTKRLYKYQHALWHIGAALIALLPLI